MSVPAPIRGFRLAAGLSQKQLAAKAHIAQRTLYAAEHGRSIRMEPRRRLLKALGIDHDRHREIFGPLPDERP